MNEKCEFCGVYLSTSQMRLHICSTMPPRIAAAKLGDKQAIDIGGNAKVEKRA